MAPKRGDLCDPDGIFAGMVVFFVENGVHTRRLQIWKQKLVQMGAAIEERLSKKVTHVFAMNSDSLLKQFNCEQLACFKAKILLYKWLEDSLKVGEQVLGNSYIISLDSGGLPKNLLKENQSAPTKEKSSIRDEHSPFKKTKTVSVDCKTDHGENRVACESANGASSPNDSFCSLSPITSNTTPDSQNKIIGKLDSSLPYRPPDLNRNITEIFGKLVNIYRALGDDRRSFSYHKAIPVIEKLPFKIETADQVKGLPTIGKSMQDHILEIVTTGKLSKLDHFEQDEKVKTISLFGEVWGVGPSTALKLYEKGHRTLEDLKNEESLTKFQKLGLTYFDDIKTRIPCDEVEEMVRLLQNAGEEILPGVSIVCGGSFRRGKASCGDVDFVMTHPDGKSHVGFLTKLVKRLKEMKFLREDLTFSIHSEEGTDSGVDTYFGLCTYPGRELRHRIDLKVYPRDLYAFALIAWTGNDVLNRRLRLLADSKGFLLDDTGLYPATQSSGQKRVAKASASLKFDTEKEVFGFLGFPWLEPHERNL